MLQLDSPFSSASSVSSVLEPDLCDPPALSVGSFDTDSSILPHCEWSIYGNGDDFYNGERNSGIGLDFGSREVRDTSVAIVERAAMGVGGDEWLELDSANYKDRGGIRTVQEFTDFRLVDEVSSMSQEYHDACELIVQVVDFGDEGIVLSGDDDDVALLDLD